jgi:hypothetical protein
MTRTDTATSAQSPPLNLPPTAAQADPPPPNPGVCPECGQQRPNPLNRFATGGHGDPSLNLQTRDVDSELVPDGEDAQRVRVMFREGSTVEQIVASTSFTYDQVLPVAVAESERQRRLHGQEV